MLEKDLQKKGIDLLSKKGAWSVKSIVSNKGGVHDVITCLPMTKEEVLKIFETQEKVGVFLSVEYKNPNGKGVTSALQLRNKKQIKNAGGITGIVESLEDLKRLLKNEQ